MGSSASVIITYRKNKERFLGKCLNAIRTQVRKFDEVMVVEDCLAGEDCGPGDVIDNACIEAFKDTNTSWQILQLETHVGKGAQINRGAELIMNDYMGICSADDYYDPCFLGESLGALERGADVTWSNYNVVDECGRITSTYNAANHTGISFETQPDFIQKTIEWGSTHGMFSCMATWFGKTSVFKAVPFDNKLTLNEDLDWLLRAAIVDKYRFAYIPKVMANYRVSSLQASIGLSREQLQVNNQYTWSKLNKLLGEKVFPEAQIGTN